MKGYGAVEYGDTEQNVLWKSLGVVWREVEKEEKIVHYWSLHVCGWVTAKVSIVISAWMCAYAPVSNTEKKVSIEMMFWKDLGQWEWKKDFYSRDMNAGVGSMDMNVS